jgi:hypothetical protein
MEYYVSDGMARSRTRHLSFLACSFSLFRFVLGVGVASPLFQVQLCGLHSLKNCKVMCVSDVGAWSVRHHGETRRGPQIAFYTSMKSLVSATETFLPYRKQILVAFLGGGRVA